MVRMIELVTSIGMIVADVIATVMILRADFASRFQKFAQLCFVWLVPVIGAIIAIAFVMNETKKGSTLRSSDGRSGASLFP
jgi:cytochrome bd-type quinol oxidase subunit 2